MLFLKALRLPVLMTNCHGISIFHKYNINTVYTCTVFAVMFDDFTCLLLGLTTLQECSSLDVTAAGWKGLDEASMQKLENAVPKLDLELWLQREDLA